MKGRVIFTAWYLEELSQASRRLYRPRNLAAMGGCLYIKQSIEYEWHGCMQRDVVPYPVSVQRLSGQSLQTVEPGVKIRLTFSNITFSCPSCCCYPNCCRSASTPTNRLTRRTNPVFETLFRKTMYFLLCGLSF